ncbi:MAG: DNA topoisomerase [Gemmataceae bacterium]
MPETIETVSIAEETEKRYLHYALSVIMARALPDVRDGLKPVQRRILYNMYHDLHLYADERPIKCAKVVGEVLGKYHPHGDASVYDALVRLAQPFTLRYPLIHGEGNFGSVDGNPAAAYRYTECKLLPLAEELMRELGQRTVDMRPTFDGAYEEPVVLPARFPHLLANGVTGIAVGMATSIPPHNLGELVKACIALIDDPDATTADLLEHIKGPDFPLGGRVLADRRTLRQIYEEGIGTIKVQGQWKLEQVGRKRQIVITSIPFGANKAALEEKIGALIAERKLPQLTGIVNESNMHEGMRIVLELKADADPELVMAYLYRHTELQQNFAYNMTVLVPDAGGQVRPRRLGLRELLRHFLDFRLTTVRRRCQYELESLRRRLHILRGFQEIFRDLDRALALIRSSDGKEDASRKLQRHFQLDADQAQAVLEMLLYRLARLEVAKVRQELEEKERQAQRLENILRSEKKLWAIVRDELLEIAQKYADRRRTKIVTQDDVPEFDPQAYIVRENTHVILTRDGWIKRVARLTRLDNTRIREGDEILTVVPGSTLDAVVFFMDDGIALTLPIHEVPASSGYGEPLSRFFRVGAGARPVWALTTDERFVPPTQVPGNGQPPPPYLVIATALGYVVRIPFAPVRTPSTVRGRLFARLTPGDRVVLVRLVRSEKSLLLVSRQGHVIHFALKEVPVLAGPGRGVLGIKLDADDQCLGGCLIGQRQDGVIAETTDGRTLRLTGERELTHRGGRGQEALRRGTIARIVPEPIELVHWDELEPS